MRLRPGVPVLARPEGALQVGIARPVVLEGLAADAAAFVAGLEQRPTRVTTEEAARYADVLAALRSAGLATHDGEPERRTLADAVVRVRGVTAVTRACAVALARAGVGTVGATSGRGDATTDAAARLHRELVSEAPGIRIAAPFAPAQLEVVAGFGAIDPVVARDLTARDLPHLPVVADDAGATVGPIIVPGRTACLRCLDLHRCDADPGWAAVAIQLAGGSRSAALRADTSAVVGAIAAREALRFLTGAPPTGAAWRIEDDRAASPVRVEPQGPHPDCGCRD